MTSIRVRRASVEDARAIAEIHVRSWRAAYRGLVPDAVLEELSVEQRERSWGALLDEGGSSAFTLVAERERRLVGFCSVATPSRDDDAGARTCEVAALYVEPDLRRTGIGGALLEAALADVRAAEWRSVTLWLLAGNDSARAFYERFGFAPDGAGKANERLGRPEARLRAELGTT